MCIRFLSLRDEISSFHFSNLGPICITIPNGLQSVLNARSYTHFLPLFLSFFHFSSQLISLFSRNKNPAFNLTSTFCCCIYFVEKIFTTWFFTYRCREAEILAIMLHWHWHFQMWYLERIGMKDFRWFHYYSAPDFFGFDLEKISSESATNKFELTECMQVCRLNYSSLLIKIRETDVSQDKRSQIWLGLYLPHFTSLKHPFFDIATVFQDLIGSRSRRLDTREFE